MRKNANDRRRSRHGIELERLEVRSLMSVSLDTSYGSGGSQVISSGLGNDVAGQICIDKFDGTILQVGTSGDNRAFVVRRDRAGNVLKSAIIDVVSAPGTPEHFRGIGLQSNGKIIIGGDVLVQNEHHFVVARLNADLTIDTSFGFGGAQSGTDFNTSIVGNIDIANALAVDASDRIYMVGNTRNVSGADLQTALVRYTPSGFADFSFDGDGIDAFNGTGRDDSLSGLVLRPGGGAYVVGYSYQADGLSNSLVIAYDNNGTRSWVDSRNNVANGGAASDDFGGVITLTPDSSRLIIGGTTNANVGGQNYRPLFYELFASTGAQDNSFGNSGFQAFNLPYKIPKLTGIATQTDGRIVWTAGVAPNDANGDIWFGRLQANGQVDTSTQTVGVAGQLDSSSGLIIDDDGLIYIGATKNSSAGTGSGDFQMIRAKTERYAFRGQPFGTNQTIEAEFFDNGGQNVAFHVVDHPNIAFPAGFRRASDFAVLATPGAGNISIGYFDPGETVQYTVNIPNPGNYRLTVNASNGLSVGSGLQFASSLGGSTNVTVPVTGSFTSFTNVSADIFLQNAGTQTITMSRTNGDACDVNSFSLTPLTAATAVTDLQLINANTDQAVGNLANGQTIDLANFPISVRALTSGSIGSVRFFDNGLLVRNENLAPYSIAGDNGPDYAPWNVAQGSHTLVVVPYSGQNGSGTAGTSKTVSFTVNASGPTGPVRINAGGSEYTTTDGKVFAADNSFSGGSASTAAYAVANTNDDPLYYDRRFGSNFTYSKAIANGHYTLYLNFAESFYTGVGQRRFDVFAEGNQILNDLDLVASAGSKTAYTRSFSVDVIDGKIDLSFVGVVGEAIVSSIALLPS